jgi:hypothetical protein
MDFFTNQNAFNNLLFLDVYGLGCLPETNALAYCTHFFQALLSTGSGSLEVAVNWALDFGDQVSIS